MIRMILPFLYLALALALLALLAGFLGRFHGAGDSLAVFRTPLALGVLALAALAFLAGARPAALGAGALALAALATVALPWLPQTGRAAASGEAVTVYQKNLWFRLPDSADLLADIRAADPDIVTLQEVGTNADALLAALATSHPTQVVCPYARVGGVAVLSRFPERPGSRDCVAGSGLASVVLETPSGPLRAASVHLHWPWPHEQPGQVADLLPRLAAWSGPAVIGGDFNMVRWSHALRSIGRASGTRPVGPPRVTLRNKRLLLNISIDHVLVTGGQGGTGLRPRAGSDHNGLLARILLP